MQKISNRLLNGHHVAKIIYGTIIILVVDLAMEDHPPSPGGVVVTILFAGLGVALADLYSEIIGMRIREKRNLTWNERNHIIKEVSAVMMGALFPLPFFILAWIGIFSLEFAFVLAKWTMVGILLFYGYIASKLSGYGQIWSIVSGIIICTVGLMVVLLKSYFGH